jgi:tetratricopeptide (TPR) repeat protein
MVLMASTAIGPISYAQFPGAPAPPGQARPDKVPEGLEAPAATEGYRAYQAGDYVTATAKLEEAKQSDPSGAVLSWLGHAYAAKGEPIKAIDELQLALAASEKPLTDDQKAMVQRKLSEVRAQVATVSISSSVPGTNVIIDGGPQQPLPLSGLRMRAGDHSFKVEAPDHDPVERTIAVAGGGQAQLELNPTKTPPPPPPPAPPPPPPPPAEPADGGTAGLVMRTAGISTAVLGALGAGVGVASLINARTLRESVSDDKTSHEALYGADCSLGDYTACYVNGLAINENVQRANSLETLGLAMTIGGGVLVAGGVVLYVLAPRGSSGQEQAAAPSVQCGPFAQGGLSCSGSF